jgi:hypothetical protein
MSVVYAHNKDTLKIELLLKSKHETAYKYNNYYI